MKLTANRILVLVGLLSSIALVICVLLRYKSVARLQFEALEKSNPLLAEKITTSRTRIAGETTAESLEKLSDINPFFWPGPQGVEGMVIVQDLLPLAPSKGRRDVDAIVSNRRARKVFADMGAGSKTATEERINRELMDSIDTYLPLYKSKLNDAEKAQKHWSGGSGIGFVIGTPNLDAITMEGLRLKILELTWFSGALELNGCSEQVQRVAQIAVGQRNDLYQNPVLNEIFKSEMAEMASLYNRQIIATGLLGAIGNPAVKSGAAAIASLKWEELSLSSHNALVTENDLPVAAGVMTADRSKGRINIKIVSPVNDEQFDAILRELVSPR